jgi:hypothetical protein
LVSSNKGNLFFTVFPTPYLVKYGFCWVTLLLNVSNNLDVMKIGDGLSMTTLQPDIEKLVNAHLTQETH